jgi:hypothetical protein
MAELLPIKCGRLLRTKAIVPMPFQAPIPALTRVRLTLKPSITPTIQAIGRLMRLINALVIMALIRQSTTSSQIAS